MSEFELIAEQPIKIVTLEEVKQHCRLNPDDSEDWLLTIYINAAQRYLEELCGPIITQTWKYTIDQWPSTNYIEIRKPRINLISEIEYKTIDGIIHQLEKEIYYLDASKKYARACLNEGYNWPTDELIEYGGIKIIFNAGFGLTADNIPFDLWAACLQLVSHFYEIRLPTSEKVLIEPPFSVSALIIGHREWGI